MAIGFHLIISAPISYYSLLVPTHDAPGIRRARQCQIIRFTEVGYNSYFYPVTIAHKLQKRTPKNVKTNIKGRKMENSSTTFNTYIEMRQLRGL